MSCECSSGGLLPRCRLTRTVADHTPRDGSIAQWRQDMAWFDKHGFDRSRVNIGLPYYTFNYTDNAAAPTHPGEKVVNEPTWGE